MNQTLSFHRHSYIDYDQGDLIGFGGKIELSSKETGGGE